jgi:hypothetical protein
MSRVSRSVLVAAALAACIAPAHSLYAKGKKGGGGGAAAPAPPPVNPMTATITADQKDVADDQTALTKATKDLNEATNKLMVDFDKTPDAIAAKKAVADADAALQTARDAALAKMADDPAYKAAVAKEAAAKAELDKLRNDDTPDQDAISAKATEEFEDGGVTTKLERAGLDGDAGYVAAQKTAADANAAYTALRNKFKDSIKDDPSLATLKQAHDDAQTKLTAAQTKLDQDRKGGTATASGG